MSAIAVRLSLAPVADSGHAAPVTTTGQLADTCADLVRKRHLVDPAALGRPPTPDEAAIHAAAVESVRTALLQHSRDTSPLARLLVEALRLTSAA